MVTQRDSHDREVLPSYEEIDNMTDLNELVRLRAVAKEAFTEISADRDALNPNQVERDEFLRRALNFYQGALTKLGDRLADLCCIERRKDKRVEQLLVAVRMFIDDDKDENWEALQAAFSVLTRPCDEVHSNFREPV